MPNGMYGGVRGERKSPLLDLSVSYMHPVGECSALVQKYRHWIVKNDTIITQYEQAGGRSMKERIVNKMIDFYKGNRSDVRHFLKVYAYAQTIGRLENLDEKTQDTLEIAAIVHDIACPLCREKYGNTNGNHQEAESEDLLRTFLLEFALPEEMQERIIYLVTHHHTYTNVEGMDYQILLEADYLVNADESQYSREAIYKFRDRVFKTESGTHMLESIYSL